MVSIIIILCTVSLQSVSILKREISSEVDFFFPLLKIFFFHIWFKSLSVKPFKANTIFLWLIDWLVENKIILLAIFKIFMIKLTQNISSLFSFAVIIYKKQSTQAYTSWWKYWAECGNQSIFLMFLSHSDHHFCL